MKYTYSEITCSLKKNYVICRNLDERGGYYTYTN